MENTLLNLVPASYLPEVHLSQYDVGRELKFTLKDGSSDYTVPSGAVVTVKATKPSGLGFVVNATAEGSVVTLSNTETMTNENGRFPAELSITQGSTVIGTSNFIFNIERSPHPEGTIDGDAESLLPELTLLVERIEAAAEDVDEKAELFLNLSAEAETLPAGSPATASYSDGVLTLGIPRGYDGDDTKADAIVKSASGEVASFTDGGNGLLVKSLKVNIVPKQSGSGEPSPDNVRPISGYTDVNVNVAGGNLFDKALYPFLKDNDDKGWFIVGSRLRKGGGIENVTLGMPCKPNTRYRITATIGYPLFRIAYGKMADLSFQTGSADQTIYNTQADNTTIGYREVIYQTGADATFLFIQFPYGYHTEGADSLIVEEIANTYPISLGQTVYGGVLDVVSGKLTITHEIQNLKNKNPNYTIEYTINNKRGVGFNYALDKVSTRANGWCDHSTVTSETDPNLPQYMWFGVNSKYIFWVGILDVLNMTLEEFKTWQSSHDVYVVDELATPIEVTLTPTQVNTLLGNNNIWSDSGTVEVEYRADTTLVYNELLSLIASLS